MRSARSRTTTSCPARVSCCAAARPAGPGADHRDLLAGPNGRDVGGDPAFGERPVDDLDLDLLDRHGVLVDPEDARRLTRRRAQPSRELGEVVRRVQTLDRVTPLIAVDQIVPVRDQVAERAPVVAERDPTIHAACGLVVELLGGKRLVHLVPVLEPNRHRTMLRRRPIELHESCWLTHVRLLAREQSDTPWGRCGAGAPTLPLRGTERASVGPNDRTSDED